MKMRYQTLAGQSRFRETLIQTRLSGSIDWISLEFDFSTFGWFPGFSRVPSNLISL